MRIGQVSPGRPEFPDYSFKTIGMRFCIPASQPNKRCQCQSMNGGCKHQPSSPYHGTWKPRIYQQFQELWQWSEVSCEQSFVFHECLVLCGKTLLLQKVNNTNSITEQIYWYSKTCIIISGALTPLRNMCLC